MSTDEYLGHLTDYQREPWDLEAVVVMLAQLTALLFNLNRSRDTPAMKPEDWLPGTRTAPEVVVPTAANFRKHL